MLYNIRYGTGSKRLLFPWSGYFRDTIQNTLDLADFIKSMEPDVVGLVEVDAGSFRSGRRNQAEMIAERIGHFHSYRSKYGKTGMLRKLPLMNKQGNAFLTKDTFKNVGFHYFKEGVKKLVIELELRDLNIYLVHLALGYRIRQSQLADLYALVKSSDKPHIIAGDLNTRWGEHEIKLFLAATGLQNADKYQTPTYPSWAPKRHLDFILYSPGLKVKRFWVPYVSFSDHLPLVCDIEVTG